MKKGEYESSESDYDDDSSSYSEEDEFYGSDEELEGGAYQLDYIDGIYGEGDDDGGVLMGGRRRRRGRSAYNKFIARLMKKKKPGTSRKYTMAEAARLWCKKSKRNCKDGKVRRRRRRTTRGRGIGGSKTMFGGAKKKKSSGRKCAANKKTYRTQVGYDRYCPIPGALYNFYPELNKICDDVGLKYCPTTQRCRKPQDAQKCFEQARIPYLIDKLDGSFHPMSFGDQYAGPDVALATYENNPEYKEKYYLVIPDGKMRGFNNRSFNPLGSMNPLRFQLPKYANLGPIPSMGTPLLSSYRQLYPGSIGNLASASQLRTPSKLNAEQLELLKKTTVH